MVGRGVVPASILLPCYTQTPWFIHPCITIPLEKDTKVLRSPVAKMCLKFMPDACFTLFFLYPVMLLVWGWCWVAACGLLPALQLGILGELFALLWDQAPVVGRQFTVCFMNPLLRLLRIQLELRLNDEQLTNFGAGTSLQRETLWCPEGDRSRKV